MADCLPIYLYDRPRGAFGLVHAGRRGTLEGIAAKAILEMERTFGTKPDECSVLFGPAIGPCCYQVSPELASEFEGRFPGCTVEGPTKITRRGYPPAGEQVTDAGQESPTRLEREESKTHLDLWRANELELRKIGVRDIVGRAMCTSCRDDLFFSHRRDGGKTGRMLAVLMRVW